MQVIRTIAELDEKIEECNRAERISDDAMRALFPTFSMEPPRDLPPDPTSDAYRDAQLALYRGIAGRDYSNANEVTAFDVGAAVARPFPYYTGSAETAGEQIMAVGIILRAMALPPGSRVLEFGPGWGNTTLALAQLGHNVTAVDIEPHFCDLIRRRAAQTGVEIEVVNDDFLWVEGAGRQFDAVLFYECFHHCADHMRLLRALRDAIAPGGRIFFAGEPIVADFPMPWGVRLDGNSLWAIRKNGWLELGFRDDYFQRALGMAGWFGQKRQYPDPAWMTIWEAHPRNQPIFKADGSSHRINTMVGTRVGNTIVYDGVSEGTGLYGPYIPLPAGRYNAVLQFQDAPPFRGRARMDVAANGGQRILAERTVDAAAMRPGAAAFVLPFSSDQALDAVEVRLICNEGFTATLQSVEIRTV